MLNDGARVTLQELILHSWVGAPMPKFSQLSSARGKANSNIQNHLDQLQAAGIVRRSERGTGEWVVSYRRLYELVNVPRSLREAMQSGEARAIVKALPEMLACYEVGELSYRPHAVMVPELRVRHPMERFLHKKPAQYNSMDLGRYFRHRYYLRMKSPAQGLHSADVMKCVSLHKEFGIKMTLLMMDWFLENWERCHLSPSPDFASFFRQRHEIARRTLVVKRPLRGGVVKV